jgi:hypothetical protein
MRRVHLNAAEPVEPLRGTGAHSRACQFKVGLPAWRCSRRSVAERPRPRRHTSSTPCPGICLSMMSLAVAALCNAMPLIEIISAPATTPTRAAGELGSTDSTGSPELPSAVRSAKVTPNGRGTERLAAMASGVNASRTAIHQPDAVADEDDENESDNCHPHAVSFPPSLITSRRMGTPVACGGSSQISGRRKRRS